MGGESMEGKLELYRIFRTVAEQESISAAARGLYLSQSAVSQSVQQLERQLGTKLFLRGRKGVALTEEGRLLYDYVRDAMSLLESGESKLRQARELEIGQLIIGASDTLTRWWLLPYLQRFHRNHPGVRLTLRNGTSSQVLELLREGKVDVAFASRPERGEQFRVEVCFDTHMIFAAAPDYPCDFDRSYTPAEVAEMPLILLDRKAGSRLFLEDAFSRMGLRLKPEFELATHELVLAVAKSGLGVACVTKEFSGHALKAGDVRPLRVGWEIPARQVAMCTPERGRLSAAAEHFMEDIRRGRPTEKWAGRLATGEESGIIKAI